MFVLYKSKLNPKSDCLWQKPRVCELNYTDEIWYENRTVGHDPLERFMKYLSKAANLSTQSYTNHSIQATVITTLDKCGFEARHITAISGHKNESTVKTYSVQCPDIKKREMHKALSTKLIPKTAVKNETTEMPLQTININQVKDMTNISQQNEKQKEQNQKQLQQNENQQQPNFQLFQFDPEEDKFLMDYLSCFPSVLDDPKPTETPAALPAPPAPPPPPAPILPPQPQPPNQLMQAQLNSTFTNTPVMPKMFFPQSYVTINYHIYPK